MDVTAKTAYMYVLKTANLAVPMSTSLFSSGRMYALKS